MGKTDKRGLCKGPCLILESIESLEDELEESVQVVRARRGDENIGVAIEEDQKVMRHNGTHENFQKQSVDW